ncbi:MAG: MFS transporter [Pseudomonadota bacterium]
MMNSTARQSFLSASIGTMVEYYDYALFTLFLPILAPLFFPADTIYDSLVKGYLILFVAMIARPLGGLFFGYLGDAVGRRKALLTSMYGIALGTLALGITPVYASIGIWSVVMVTVAKTIQVFCFGGEFNGAGIYVVEHAQNRNEGFASCLLLATTLFGSLLSCLLGIVLTMKFMPDWSWRIAFLVGGLIGLIGIRYRKQLIESPHFKPAKEDALPLGKMLKKFPKEFVATIFLGGFASISFTTTLTFITPVLMSEGLINMHQLMLLETFLTLLAVVTLIPTGIMADKKSPQKVMVFSCWALIILSYFLLYLIEQRNVIAVLVGMSVLIIINEMQLGPMHAFLKNLFPMEYRYRGSSLGFCIGISVLGGLTPLVESYLYSYTHHFTAISLWLVFIGAGTLITMNLATNKKTEEVYDDNLRRI